VVLCLKSIPLNSPDNTKEVVMFISRVIAQMLTKEIIMTAKVLDNINIGLTVHLSTICFGVYQLQVNPYLVRLNIIVITVMGLPYTLRLVWLEGHGTALFFGTTKLLQVLMVLLQL